jgi:Fic family protein
VRREGDWETWLSFFLEGVEVTGTGALTTARRLVQLFGTDSEAIRGLGGRITSNVLRVHDALRQRPVSTLNQVAERAGISFPTAAKGMAALVDLGIARELTGGRRNRIFAYGRYLDILNEGAEPL